MKVEVLKARLAHPCEVPGLGLMTSTLVSGPNGVAITWDKDAGYIEVSVGGVTGLVVPLPSVAWMQVASAPSAKGKVMPPPAA